jgi:lysophospholipase L1-like esterase
VPTGILRRRRLLPGACLAVAALVVAAACSSDRGTLTAPSFGASEDSAPNLATGGDGGRDGGIDSVAIVGDSITLASEVPLQDGLRALGLDVEAIDAASGRRITAGGGAGSSGVDTVVALDSRRPDLWVIALGANDVFQYDGEEAYRDQIATLLNALPPDVPVVWVDTYLAEDPERSAEFNRALRDTLAFRGTASVADWATVAAGEGVLTDGIHPSEEGARQYARVVMSAVEPWLG